MKKSLGYSLTVHLVLLSLLLFGLPKGCGTGNFKKQEGLNAPKSQEGSIVEKQTIQVELEEPKEGITKKEPSPSPKPSSKFVDRDCGKLEWFGGIGVQGEYETGSGDRMTAIVAEVVKGYPAYDMGVKVGDRILNFSELKGEPGTDVTVEIYRSGETLTLTGTREKICLESKKE
jgi:hypothetical protein